MGKTSDLHRNIIIQKHDQIRNKYWVDIFNDFYQSFIIYMFNKFKLKKVLFDKVGPKFCLLVIISFQKIAKNPLKQFHL